MNQISSLIRYYYHKLTLYLFKRKCSSKIIYNRKPCHKKAICLFSSFSPNSTVTNTVIHYLQNLNSKGFEIVFIVTSEEIRKQDYENLKTICFAIIHRENICMDFGSWHTGLFFLRDKQLFPELLLLTNDSVIGPFSDIKLDFGEKFAIQGMTESFEISRHLQSYFLLIPKKVMDSHFFYIFWFRDFRYLKKKISIIYCYEIGFSYLALKGGFQLQPLIRINEGLQKNIKDKKLNPTLSHWEELINNGFPFIKKSLLNDESTRKKVIEKFKKTSSIHLF